MTTRAQRTKQPVSACEPGTATNGRALEPSDAQVAPGLALLRRIFDDLYKQADKVVNLPMASDKTEQEKKDINWNADRLYAPMQAMLYDGHPEEHDTLDSFQALVRKVYPEACADEVNASVDDIRRHWGEFGDNTETVQENDAIKNGLAKMHRAPKE
jgi:hypothetical protein